MRKQITHAMLSVFLCASGLAQRVEVFGGAQFAPLQSSFNAVGRNTTENFEGKGKNTIQSKSTTRA